MFSDVGLLLVVGRPLVSVAGCAWGRRWFGPNPISTNSRSTAIGRPLLVIMVVVVELFIVAVVVVLIVDVVVVVVVDVVVISIDAF